MLHYLLKQPLDLEKYISVLMKSLAEKIVPKNNKSRLGVVQKVGMKLSSQAINSFNCVCSLGWLVEKVKLKSSEHYKGPMSIITGPPFI